MGGAVQGGSSDILAANNADIGKLTTPMETIGKLTTQVPQVPCACTLTKIFPRRGVGTLFRKFQVCHRSPWPMVGQAFFRIAAAVQEPITGR